MAEYTAKRRGELIRKAFEILLKLPDGLPAKEVLERVEKSLPPTVFEKASYPNRPDVRRFEKMVRFASIRHVKAGWLLKSKGRWFLTEEGRQAYQKFKDPVEFDRHAYALYRQWAKNRVMEAPEVEEDEKETVGAAITLEKAEELAFAEIQQHLQEMNPYDFQKLVAGLLRAMGYYVSYVAPPGPDRGVDIVAHTDPLGTTVPRIKVQVKRQEAKVDVKGLRAFLAVLGDQDMGLFVCTGGFTSDADEEARTQEKRKVTLLGVDHLFDLWVQHYDKVAEEDRQLLPLRPVYYLAPTE
jgi:restriction system protein